MTKPKRTDLDGDPSWSSNAKFGRNDVQLKKEQGRRRVEWIKEQRQRGREHYHQIDEEKRERTRVARCVESQIERVENLAQTIELQAGGLCNAGLNKEDIQRLVHLLRELRERRSAELNEDIDADHALSQCIHTTRSFLKNLQEHGMNVRLHSDAGC